MLKLNQNIFHSQEFFTTTNDRRVFGFLKSDLLKRNKINCRLKRDEAKKPVPNHRLL
jgi:hypothetical protein